MSSPITLNETTDLQHAKQLQQRTFKDILKLS